MKRRSFIKSLGAAVALMAADPMFGGTAWGMDRGIDRRPPMIVLTVTGGRLPPDTVDRLQDFIDNELHTGPWKKPVYLVEEPGDQDTPWQLTRHVDLGDHYDDRPCKPILGRVTGAVGIELAPDETIGKAVLIRSYDEFIKLFGTPGV